MEGGTQAEEEDLHHERDQHKVKNIVANNRVSQKLLPSFLRQNYAVYSNSHFSLSDLIATINVDFMLQELE